MAVEMHGVGVLRDGRWILRQVDWQVAAGTLAAVLGPNGSGKSTLARVAACHWWPTRGRCGVLGEEFGRANLPELRRRVRLVQPAGPYDVDASLSARDVVLTGYFGSIGLYQPPTAAMKRESRRLLELVALGQVADHPYNSLSSGERVRSLIARAMVGGPRLLILDEPTAGLDLRGREQVLATVAALLRQPDPPAVVLITHHVEELPPATEQVLLLNRGKPAAQGTMAQVLQEQILSRVYGVPVSVRTEAGRYYLQVHPSAWKEVLARRRD
ncbi:MAG: ATP-binding cassette domain-containing protein [Tepidisphaeraceae bacterium]